METNLDIIFTARPTLVSCAVRTAAITTFFLSPVVYAQSHLISCYVTCIFIKKLQRIIYYVIRSNLSFFHENRDFRLSVPKTEILFECYKKELNNAEIKCKTDTNMPSQKQNVLVLTILESFFFLTDLKSYNVFIESA